MEGSAVQTPEATQEEGSTTGATGGVTLIRLTMLGVLEMDDANLRDFYAGLAMLGWLSQGNPASHPDGVAEIAFDVAEAMMKEKARRDQSDRRDGQSV